MGGIMSERSRESALSGTCIFVAFEKDIDRDA